MPFQSDAQRAFMYAKHPKIAKKWRKESGPQTDLPKYKNEKPKSPWLKMDSKKGETV